MLIAPLKKLSRRKTKTYMSNSKKKSLFRVISSFHWWLLHKSLSTLLADHCYTQLFGVLQRNIFDSVAVFSTILYFTFTSLYLVTLEIDTRLGKANAVLVELYRSMVTKRQLSSTAKLSVYKSVFAPIFT